MRRMAVAVVGSGPSGAYCTQLLCEDESLDVRVDVYERLPAPYGLLRYGVAPDHTKIKSIASSFAEIYADPRVRFLGNVSVGVDVSLGELRNHYDAVIVACGASVDRRLGVSGEELPGVFSATDFVAWYSGHPDAAVDRFTLNARRVLVVGVGNVALDLARMLVLTPEELRRTDVPQHVVDVLSASSVREICIVGRRAPRFAKFTPKELVELGAHDGADVVVDPTELEHDLARRGEPADPTTRRLLATLGRLSERRPAGRPRRIQFRFGLQPTQVMGAGTVQKVRLDHTDDPSAPPVDLDADLVLRSIGYRGTALDGVPFDRRTGTIPHRHGRVVDGEHVAPGLYTVGWIKRGPSGVVGTNRKDAMETVGALVEDVRSGRCRVTRVAAQDPVDLLRARGIAVVDWDGWRRIEQTEAAFGAQLGRGSVKLHDWVGLLRAAVQ